MWNQPSRMVPWSIAVVAGLAMTAFFPARGQEKAKAEVPPAGESTLEHPKPITVENLLPTLPTVPIRHGAPAFNVEFVDATLLPRDKQGIWVLNFGFKPLRMRTFEPKGKGRKHIHYLAYRVVNRTGKPRDFVPQFTLVTETGKR